MVQGVAPPFVVRLDTSPLPAPTKANALGATRLGFFPELVPWFRDVRLLFRAQIKIASRALLSLPLALMLTQMLPTVPLTRVPLRKLHQRVMQPLRMSVLSPQMVLRWSTRGTPLVVFSALVDC